MTLLINSVKPNSKPGGVLICLLAGPLSKLPLRGAGGSRNNICKIRTYQPMYWPYDRMLQSWDS